MQDDINKFKFQTEKHPWIPEEYPSTSRKNLLKEQMEVKEVSKSMKTLFLKGSEKKKVMKKKAKTTTTTASPHFIRPRVGGEEDIIDRGDKKSEKSELEKKGEKVKPAQQLMRKTPGIYKYIMRVERKQDQAVEKKGEKEKSEGKKKEEEGHITL